MKKILLLLALTLTSLIALPQAKWYLSQTCCAPGNQPWGSASNINAMNLAFGVGSWNQGQYSTVNVNALLQPTVCLIFMEGGSLDATALNNFLIPNLPAIQAWVFNGGRLLINAAPNQGGNINYGFGGMLLNYAFGPYSASGNAVIPAHPIFNGPFIPAGIAYTGNWWCHGYVTGPGATALVNGTTPGNSLVEKPWGAGLAMFGSMTTSNWHLPNPPNANNFIANVLSYLYVCCIQPTITIVATPSVLCSGSSTTLTASGAGIGGTYTWTPPAPGTTVTGATVTFTPLVTGIYTAQGTTTTGCVGTKTVQIIVNPTPTVVPANSGPVCQGGALNLSVLAVPGGTPSYNWTGPNGFISNIQNPVINNIQPISGGVYTITISNTFTNGGVCQSFSTTTVGVVPVNQVTVTPTFTLCQGSTLSLTAVNGVPPTSYLWNGPNGFVSNLANPTVTNVLPVNAGTYSVVASFSTPGIPLVCTSNGTTNVSVVATSPITITVPPNICQNTNALLSVTSNPLAQNYSWTGPNGFTGNGTNIAVPNIQTTYSGIYSVTATWALGTVSCNIGGTGQISVIPVPSITINPPINVCYPSNVQLTASSPGAISYNWSASNGFISNLQNPLFGSPTPTVNGTYTVTTAYTNGVLTCFNTNTTQVTVNPIISFTLPPYQQICYNATYTVNGPSGASSYTWTGPNGYTVNTQMLNIPSAQTQMSGTYTLEVSLGPCKTGAVTQVDVLPPISFMQTPSSRTICIGDSTTLKVEATGGSGNYAYNWNPPTYLSSPTGSIQYSYPQGTTFYNISAYDITCPNYSINTSFVVTVNRFPTPKLILPTSSCEPFCTIFNSKIKGESNSVIYDFGNDNKISGDSINICLNAGIYNLKIWSFGKNGCNGVTEYGNPIVVNPKPGSDFLWDPTSPNNISDNRVTFHPSSRNGKYVLHSWYFLDGKEANDSKEYPTVIYDTPGIFPIVLVSTNEWGCKDTVLKTIEIKEDFGVYIPSAFTPNGTGLNEQFFPVVNGAKEYRMSIFDRWGELMVNNVKNGKWDGTFKGLYCKDGVYVYNIIVLKTDGTRKEYVGHVTLLK